MPSLFFQDNFMGYTIFECLNLPLKTRCNDKISIYVSHQLKRSLGAIVKLLLCDLMVTGSNHENSRLQC